MARWRERARLLRQRRREAAGRRSAAMNGGGNGGPLRVLVLANYFERDGGTSKVLTECKYLVPLGVRPAIVLPRNPFARADVRPQLRALGVRFFPAPVHYRMAPFFLPYAVWRIGRIIRAERIELLHANHGRTLRLAAILSRRHRLPLVYTIHGVSRRELPRWRVAALFRRVARAIAVSAESAEFLLRRARVPRERLQVLGNAIDFPRFATAAGRSDDGGILFLSRLDRDRHRAVRAVMDGAALLAGEWPALRLRILGTGRELSRARRRARAVNARCGRELVTVLGWADDPAPWIAGAAAVLGVGRCVLEAIAAGRPALVVGSERIGGWVTAGNFRDLQRANFSGRGSGPATSAAGVAAELRRVRDGLAPDEGARRLAFADHDAAVLARKLRDVYGELLPGRTANPPG
jgi:glycosyltransferase involved in cell wall biosynthesis